MEMILSPDSIDQFRMWLIEIGSPENTTKSYTTDLRVLLEKMGPASSKTEFETLAANYLNKARSEGTLAPSSIRRKRAAFRQYASWQNATVLERYKAPKIPPAMPHPVPGGIPTVIKLLDVARLDHQKALVALCGLCGLRVSEAVNVTCDNFTVNEDITLHVFGKGYKTRNVPVSDRAWGAIAPSWAAAMRSRDRRIVPIGNRTARRAITSLGRRIGLQIASHDLRSTFATALWESSNHNLFMLQEVLGHEDPATTKMYTEVDPKLLTQAINFEVEE